MKQTSLSQFVSEAYTSKETKSNPGSPEALRKLSEQWNHNRTTWSKMELEETNQA
ncbi:hypothetical protein [Roseivirga sp.]|uniref:hypothetical protein n=1 Tax=Roseivirga sp. TaxID=1964215 RepID=UPI002B27B4F2|nr:hypothetical protein [Roseivirga sp.]